MRRRFLARAFHCGAALAVFLLPLAAEAADPCVADECVCCPDVRKDSDGCSVDPALEEAKADGKDTLVKELEWGRETFHLACVQHDRCYTVPGRTKKECDNAFFDDMQSICSDEDDRRIRCRRIASLFWYDVSNAARHDESFSANRARGMASCRKRSDWPEGKATPLAKEWPALPWQEVDAAFTQRTTHYFFRGEEFAVVSGRTGEIAVRGVLRGECPDEPVERSAEKIQCWPGLQLARDHPHVDAAFFDPSTSRGTLISNRKVYRYRVRLPPGAGVARKGGGGRVDRRKGAESDADRQEEEGEGGASEGGARQRLRLRNAAPEETMNNPIGVAPPDTPIARYRDLYRIAELDDGYPKTLGVEWHGAPDDVNAAFWAPEPVTAHAIDRETRPVVYMFTRTSYYRFDAKTQTLDPGYPRPIGENWPGLFSARISAALTNYIHELWRCELGGDCVLEEPQDFWFLRANEVQSWVTRDSCIE